MKTMTEKAKAKFWRDRETMDREREEANDPTKHTLYNCPGCGAQQGEDGPEVVGTHPGTDWVECGNCGMTGPDQVKYGIVKGAALRALEAWNGMVGRTRKPKPNGTGTKPDKEEER